LPIRAFCGAIKLICLIGLSRWNIFAGLGAVITPLSAHLMSQERAYCEQDRGAHE
jgi:hypothetical protein